MKLVRPFVAAVTAAFLVSSLGVLAQESGGILIRGATIINADGRAEGDILIQGETIAEIGPDLTAPAGAREIDADGLLVLPGAIDPHVHPIGSVENLTTSSASALAGGVTTISYFMGPARDSNEDLAAAIRRAGERIRTEAMADFIVHTNINDPVNQIDQLDQVVAARQPSIKIFLNNPRFDQNARAYVDLIHRAGELGLLTFLHCEDDSLIQHLGQRFIDEGKGDLRYYAEARPTVTEEVATQRCVAISEVTEAPVLIVHMSSEDALRAAEIGKERGLPVFTEVRHLYLYLTDDVYEREDVGLFIGRPPMRTQRDVDYMWQGIVNGTIDIVDTDHSGYTREEKLTPQTVLDHRAGMNALQDYLPMIWSEGVHTNKITPEQFVAVVAANPAKLMGLYPRKGVVAVGSDADLVLWDPNETRVVRDEDELSAAAHSIYAGHRFTGWPQTTIRRGDVVWENRQMKATPGSGQLIPRERWQEPWSDTP